MAEQIVDNPVPQGRGGGALPGSLAGQGSTAADVEQIVDIPVFQGRRRRSGSLQGSLPREGSSANVEQIVAFPVRGGLQGFLPGQVPHRVDSFKMRMRDFKGFFSHFSPAQKKVRRLPARRLRACPPVSARPR